jgi:ribosomal protein S12 methylthiotransferase
LRSTFIVGFPGETEADFELLLDWLREARLDRVGCFKYSPVAGAAANALPDPVPDAVMEERRERFMAVAAAISAEKLAAKVGRRLRVLVDQVDADEGAIARSAADAPEIDGVVRIAKPGKKLQAGDWADVQITGADDYDLHAKIARAAAGGAA